MYKISQLQIPALGKVVGQLLVGQQPEKME